MNSSGVSAALHRGFEVHPPDSQAFQPRHMKCDLLGSSSNGMNGAPFSTERVRVRIPRSSVGKLSVVARIRKGKKTAETEYPWSDPFERPLAELEKKIAEVRDLANDTGQSLPLDRGMEQIIELEQKYEQWVELHGDRAGYDDPAIVTGVGSIDGTSFMFIGHQKGRNTKENIYRNFAMPTPHGYRKALRMMRHADHHGFPIITFIDTPGAYADIKSEETGQGEAIAQNLRSMFGLKVPIVTVVIGEGGSGGALAIGCGNKMLMLENSVYYVARGEPTLLHIGHHFMEPLGGAHMDPFETSKRIKDAVMKHMRDLVGMDTGAMMQQRVAKFRAIGGWQEGVEIDPYRKRNMKKRDAPMSEVTNHTISPPESSDSSVKEKTESLNEDSVKVEMQQPLDSTVKDSIENLKKDDVNVETKQPSEWSPKNKTHNLKRDDVKLEMTEAAMRSTVNVNASARHEAV